MMDVNVEAVAQVIDAINLNSNLVYSKSCFRKRKLRVLSRLITSEYHFDNAISGSKVNKSSAV